MTEFRCSDSGCPACQITADSHIKEIKFLRFYQTTFYNFAPWLNPECKERVLQNLKIVSHHLGADTIAGEGVLYQLGSLDVISLPELNFGF